MNRLSSIRDITVSHPLKIVFVCLGNICRSPTAEGIFIHKVRERRLELFFYIDSAGTAAYHVGEPANSKSQFTANKYGVHLPSRARLFEYEDLKEFDLIVAMDSSNMKNISALDRTSKFEEKLFMMRDFDPSPDDKNVPDPYYGGMHGFEKVYEIVERSCDQLLNELVKAIKN